MLTEYWEEVKWMAAVVVTISQVYHSTDTVWSYSYMYIFIVWMVGMELPEIVSWFLNVAFLNRISISRVYTVSYTLIHVGCMLGMISRQKYISQRNISVSIWNIFPPQKKKKMCSVESCKQLTCRHLSQSTWDLPKSFCPARSGVSHHAHIIAHVTKVFGQSDT